MKNSKDFKQILIKKKHFTLVIGSGFHKYMIGDKKSILTDWNFLLNIIFKSKDNNLIRNYILEFERRLVEKTAKQNVENANKVENKLIKDLCEKIEKKQKEVLNRVKFPNFLFDSKYVSNVISLNFDLIPEIILNNNKVPGLITTKSTSISKRRNNMRRHREVNGIKFWHPHGDIKSKESLILGMRQYIHHLGHLEEMRDLHKSKDKTKKRKKNYNEINDTDTWYEALVTNPVLVIGAGLSDNELDIWGALVNRERNFAKEKNQIKYRNPVYMLWSDCKSESFNKPKWIKPLLPTSMCYAKQWETLEKLFKRLPI